LFNVGPELNSELRLGKIGNFKHKKETKAIAKNTRALKKMEGY